MPKDKLTDYSATNASNTDVGGVNIDEGMLPSGVNNAIREVLSHLKNFASGTDGIDVLSLADDDASAAMKIQAPASVTADTTLTLPDGDGSDGQALVTDGSGTLSWASLHSARNLVINGAMQVAQRNSSSAVTVAHNSYQTVDRILFLISNDGAFTSEQSSTAPDGFSNSLKLAVTTADTSIGATQYAYFDHRIEAQNLQHLNYGTASAKDITLSFWVRSSKTGTYCITVQKTDSTRYHFVKEYTIDTADTWEHKTITIAPDSNIKASGGAITNDNGDGLRISWFLSCGSTYASATDNVWSSDTNDYATSNQVNWLDSTSNDFYLTGVQLTVGDVALPFIHESYGETLAKCQRYYLLHTPSGYNILVGPAFYEAAGTAVCYCDFPIEMRATPSLSAPTGTNYYYLYPFNDSFNSLTIAIANTKRSLVFNNTEVSGTAGNATVLRVNNPNAYVAFDAEL